MRGDAKCSLQSALLVSCRPLASSRGTIAGEINAYWTPVQRGCEFNATSAAAVRDVDDIRAAFSKSLAISFPRRHVQEDVPRQVRRPEIGARRGLVLRRLPRAPVRSFVYLPHEEAPRVKSFFRAAHTARADSSFLPLGDKRLFSSSDHVRVCMGSVHRH